MAPKWYLHEPFMLGADVPDGREGRSWNGSAWMPAGACRDQYPHTIFETRPVPERMVTLPPLPESVVRSTAESVWVTPNGIAFRDACREAVEKLDAS